MIAALLIALHFTLPAFERDSVCRGSTVPVAGLAAVRLYGAPRGGNPALLDEHAASIPGAPDSFTFDRPGIWSLYITVLDSSGNESCESNLIGAGLTVSVPLSSPRSRVQWYDVAGRRLPRAPCRPGVYFRRTGRNTDRLIVF